MILGMIWVSRYHAVIDCQNKKVIFRIPHQPEFFAGEHNSAKRKAQSVCATAEIKKKGVPVWNEFPMYLKRSQDFHPTEQLSSPSILFRV